MSSQIHIPTVSQVFGTTRQLPDSYFPRSRQQDELRAALNGDGHIVIWGEPFQGKSSLLRYQLRKADHCVIECAYAQQRHDVYRMLLCEAGASVAIERKRRRSRGIGAQVSFLKGDLQSDTETTEHAFDIDISNITDVLRVIEQSGFDKHVILDDFHHLGRPVQREIIQDLKAVYEKSALRLIIVGVWADRDQLRGLHIDLGGRVDSIEVPRWTDDELAQVLQKGESLLHVRFAEPAREQLLARAQQSVGLLQELACKACLESGYQEGGLAAGATIGEDAVNQAVQQVIQHSSGRMRWYVSNLAKRRGQPHQGILHALLMASDENLREGIPAARLLEAVQRLYPFEAADLDYDELIGALARLGAVHRTLRVRPVLEYDAVGDRLHVVDPLARLYWTSPDGQSLIDYLPDQGRDTEQAESRVSQRQLDDNVLVRYGHECAVCPVSRPELIAVVRLANPPYGHGTDPEYGLPLCLNHADALKNDLMAFEPETTRVFCADPVALNITRKDLTHLPGRPSESALQSAWRYSGWRLNVIWGSS